jgi:hypothetical protein
VTEAEWLSCTDPQAMQAFLQGKASNRKLRLFAVACCRRVQSVLVNSPCHRAGVRAIVVWERFVDEPAVELELGSIRGQTLSEVVNACAAVAHPADFEYLARACVAAAVNYIGDDAASAAGNAAEAAGHVALLGLDDPRLADIAASWEGWIRLGPQPLRERQAAAEAYVANHPAYLAANRAEGVVQGRLLHDLFGPLPFRAVAAQPAWVAWNGGAVVKMAQAAYDQRALPSGELDPARLAVLADALEEAGCTLKEILDHLRGPGPHVRGCWSVDVLLGRE